MEPPINILIVDDEPKNLTVLETVLDDPGYRLVRAESADNALLALVANEFALLILDIRMPGTTGFELAQLIKQRRKTARVPIIFLTAYYNEDQHVLEGYDVGAVDYLHKPVNARVLRSKVAVFAELHRKQRERDLANRSLLTEVAERRRAEEQLRELNETLDRRVAERTEALRGSEERFRKVFDYAGTGIAIADMKGQLQNANPAYCTLLGYTPEELRQIKFDSLIHPDDQQGNHAAVQGLLNLGLPHREIEHRYLRKDGSLVWVCKVLSVLRDETGAAINLVALVTDMTERKRFEDDREAHLVNEQLLRAEAEGANRAKDIFLATLSHEMRTPLNAIVGWMGILRREGCREQDLHEGLAVIDRNTRAQVQLIEDVLDVSRIVSGKLRLELRPCELTEAINAGIDVVRAAAEARDIALDVSLDAHASRAYCDFLRIQQVVWNLLSNAVKFTPRGGKVRVVLGREHSTSRIEVSDNGQGISAELLPFVFDRFRQADSSTRRRLGGLGLGLSIVRHIVELHGGTVEAHSDGEGKGSTFIVRLPIGAMRIDDGAQKPAQGVADLGQGRGGDNGDGAPSDAQPTALPMVRLDGLRVLVVDDEPDARRLLVKLLEGAGAIVSAAGSACDAIAAISNELPDILVSDLGMPDQDGFDLIRQLRKDGHRSKELPAVALTAYVREGDQREALSAGFQVHVPKPVDLRHLTAVIAELTGRVG